jgi:hypothetical protein
LRQAYDYWQDQPGNYNISRGDFPPLRNQKLSIFKEPKVIIYEITSVFFFFFSFPFFFQKEKGKEKKKILIANLFFCKIFLEEIQLGKKNIYRYIFFFITGSSSKRDTKDFFQDS